jgi:hypothetical protein
MFTALLNALGMAFAMGWEILWPLVLGFALSAVIQAIVSHREHGEEAAPNCREDDHIYGWTCFWVPEIGTINLSDGGFLLDPTDRQLYRYQWRGRQKAHRSGAVGRAGHRDPRKEMRQQTQDSGFDRRGSQYCCCSFVPKRISNSPGPSELGTMTASAAEMERIDIFLITSECANGQKSKPTILARVSPDASRMQRT